MCVWSREHASRRATQGEAGVVRNISAHNGARHNVVAPATAESGIDAVCLLTGDRVRFAGLSPAFQEAHSVPANAVALFIEADNPNTAKRDALDRFDFQNGEVVAVRDVPLGTELRVVALAGQDLPEDDTDDAVVAEEEEEMVGVGGARAQLARVAGAAMVALAVVLSLAGTVKLF